MDGNKSGLWNGYEVREKATEEEEEEDDDEGDDDDDDDDGDDDDDDEEMKERRKHARTESFVQWQQSFTFFKVLK